jgi:hypothetical protein
MERRAFLQLLGIGMGMVTALAAAPTKATILATPLAGPSPAPEPGVTKPEDIERAEVQKAYYGHWRRVTRRHYRRVSRRVYRRHAYY